MIVPEDFAAWKYVQPAVNMLTCGGICLFWNVEELKILCEDVVGKATFIPDPSFVHEQTFKAPNFAELRICSRSGIRVESSIRFIMSQAVHSENLM